MPVVRGFISASREASGCVARNRGDDSQNGPEAADKPRFAVAAAGNTRDEVVVAERSDTPGAAAASFARCYR